MSARHVREELEHQLIKMNGALQDAGTWLDRADNAVTTREGGRMDGLDLAGAVAAFAHAAHAALKLAEFHRVERNRIESQMTEQETWKMVGRAL